MTGVVTSVSASATHSFGKDGKDSIRLITGVGVAGDAHGGRTVQHRSRVARDPSQPNLRQLHLIHAELHDELRTAGFGVAAGEMGENVTTRGIDLLRLSTGAMLHLGNEAVVEVTGLRNPCVQLDRFQPGLLGAVLRRDPRGSVERLAGVMAVVVSDGEIRPGDPIRVELPSGAHRPLVCV